MAKLILVFDDEERLPWRTWRYLVLRRSGFRCDNCGITEAELKVSRRTKRGATTQDLHAHHINRNGQDHRLANGMTVCPSCHSRLHRIGGRVINSAKAWATRRARYGPSGFSEKARAHKTHCSEGHPFDEANTFVRSDGGRGCRICDRKRKREHMRKKRSNITTCKHGHPINDENTYFDKLGRRGCRICQQVRSRKRWDRVEERLS